MAEVSSHFIHATAPLVPGDAVCAIVRRGDGRVLLQLRDDKPEIFYPGHWGLFGGAVEPGEAPGDALRRELLEELGVRIGDFRWLARFDFDLSGLGTRTIWRMFYEVHLDDDQVNRLVLGEGREVRAFTREEALALLPIAPYDAFALWWYFNQTRIAAGQ